MSTIQGVRIRIGDLFRDDPKAAGGAMAMMQVGPLIAMSLGPQIGGALVAKDVRLPFVFSGLLTLGETLLVLYKVPETRPKTLSTQRLADVWKKMNPLEFL